MGSIGELTAIPSSVRFMAFSDVGATMGRKLAIDSKRLGLDPFGDHQDVIEPREGEFGQSSQARQRQTSLQSAGARITLAVAGPIRVDIKRCWRFTDFMFSGTT